MLMAEHEGLTLQNYPGEEAWIVGGRPLNNLHWREYDISAGRNIWVADIMGAVRGLRVADARAIPARFPNADPERDSYPKGYVKKAKSWWGASHQLSTTLEVTSPNWSNMMQLFETYTMGVDGECDNFEPPANYWCSSHVSGGGASGYTYPRGLTFDKEDLPKRWGNWTVGSGAELHVWRPAHWANWMYEIVGYNWDNANIILGRGGFQGARGNMNGAEWFVSHVFDELDAPGEYFHDAAAGKLYIYHNSSGAPPADGSIVAVTTKVLLSANASQRSPIRNVTVRDLGFRDAAATYLDPHGVPSGGDWALQRTAAVFLERTEGFSIDRCSFQRLDGNAVMLSAYNRDASITRSHFNWIGDSAMAAWGFTDELSSETRHGFDGTNGNFPIDTRVEENLVHELGIYEKQISMWFQAKSARTLLKHSIFFNGPRAGINFNDCFGGGDEVAQNIIFNTCRESGDHGPINSWDRLPYLTTVRNGTPSLVPADRNIHHNFIVSNYQGTKGVDNDDGSSYYQIHHNFLVGGWMHKSNFGGHSKDSFNNLGAFATMGMRMQAPQFPAYVDSFYNNTCIFKGRRLTFRSSRRGTCARASIATSVSGTTPFTATGHRWSSRHNFGERTSVSRIGSAPPSRRRCQQTRISWLGPGICFRSTPVSRGKILRLFMYEMLRDWDSALLLCGLYNVLFMPDLYRCGVALVSSSHLKVNVRQGLGGQTPSLQGLERAADWQMFAC